MLGKPARHNSPLEPHFSRGRPRYRAGEQHTTLPRTTSIPHIGVNFYRTYVQIDVRTLKVCPTGDMLDNWVLTGWV